MHTSIYDAFYTRISCPRLLQQQCEPVSHMLAVNRNWSNNIFDWTVEAYSERLAHLCQSSRLCREHVTLTRKAARRVRSRRDNDFTVLSLIRFHSTTRGRGYLSIYTYSRISGRPTQPSDGVACALSPGSHALTRDSETVWLPPGSPSL